MATHTPITESILARFWAKVNKVDGGCWLWTAGRTKKNGHGYGLFIPVKNNGSFLAHRFSWSLVNGPIPDGMVILHSCDVPLCVNPDHMSIGTQEQNLHDMYEKGRGAIGAKHGRSKLTEADVIEMRRLRETQRLTYKVLAERFGVSDGAAHKICTRLKWKHI